MIINVIFISTIILFVKSPLKILNKLKINLNVRHIFWYLSDTTWRCNLFQSYQSIP